MIEGYVRIFRAGLAAMVRALGVVPLALGELVLITADLLDPDMPESVRRPREWLPRLWERIGIRAPAEDRD